MGEDLYWMEKTRRGSSVDFFQAYHKEMEMGKGVTSTVFKCRRKDDGNECAVKVIQKMGAGKRKKVISSEVEALLRLNHPNIVQMLDLYESVGEVFIVLELAAGGELFDRIVAKGHYSEKEAARVTAQVLAALEYSHGQGIAHRDIKPENILYSSKSDDSLIKISDFGFAKNTDDGIMSTFCGTIGYCAPEVVLKKPYGSAVDLWSLGVVLYILLCGYEPFWDEGGEPGVTRKIVYGEYEFESPYWDDISEPAKALVTQMMTVDPEKRPTASEALRNPWVSGHAASDIHLSRTQEQIKKLHAKRKFRIAVKAVKALHIMKSGGGSGSDLSPDQ